MLAHARSPTLALALVDRQTECMLVLGARIDRARAGMTRWNTKQRSTGSTGSAFSAPSSLKPADSNGPRLRDRLLSSMRRMRAKPLIPFGNFFRIFGIVVILKPVRAVKRGRHAAEGTTMPDQ
jgi:hypothetical protein